MTLSELQVLICTTGREASRPALAYGAKIAHLLGIPAQLLGIEKKGVSTPEEVAALLAEGEAELQKLGVPYQVVLKSGSIEDIVPPETEKRPSLTVIPPLERSTLQTWLQGDPLNKLVTRMSQPIFHVPEMKYPMKHILCSVGGLAYATSLFRFCVYLAKASGADLTLLYVIEPANLDEPFIHPVDEPGLALLDTDTPQGRNLRRMRDEAMSAGVDTQIRLRHGIPVREILAQINDADYDLVGVGSPLSANAMRQRYLPNITGMIIQMANCPVVTVRYGFELES